MAVENKTSFERHFQSLLLAALTALLGWTAITTQNQTVKIAELSVQVKGLVDDVSELREHETTTYSRSDALRWNAAADSRISKLEQDIHDLEMKLERSK